MMNLNYLIYLLFFISGACSLMYELIWLRKLALIFGNTTFATSSILTAFMGGLALGSYLIGKYADKVKSPLKLYGYLELGIGGFAVIILFLFLPVSDSVYIWTFRNVGQNGILFNVIRFLLSGLILIIPTTLMGGTLPVVSKFLIDDTEKLGRKIGLLYALNTFGGVVGAYFTGYHLIRLFGETWSLWLAILLNFSIAAIAVYFGSREKGTQAIADEKREKSKKVIAVQPAKDGAKIGFYSQKTAKIVLWLFAAAGFTSLAYEVIWTRALIFFVSSTTYSFTIILVTFLTGITLGSLVISKWVDKIKNPILWFGLFEVMISLAAILSIPLLRNMYSIHHWILAYLNTTQWRQVTFFLFVTAFIILIVPAFFMGAVFPIVNRICVHSLPRLGRGVGSVYMANTIGAILGSFFSGFVMLPLLGIQESILMLTIVNLFIGLFVFTREQNFGRNKRSYFPVMAASVVLFVVINLSFFTTKSLFTHVLSFQDTRILFRKDASAATLSVLEKQEDLNIWGENVRFLNINGHNTAHTTYADIIIHKMLAHLPMLLHPNPQSALVIGFGFGNTCQSFLQYDIKKVDCVELLGSEKESAKYFEEENRGVFTEPRFRFIENDGRNYILATEKRYDIISVNAVDPKFSPALYTNQFYRLCRNNLRPDGYLVAWLPISGMTEKEVLSLIKSFVAEFPHSSLWYNNPEHLLLLGSKTELKIDVSRLQRRLAVQAIQKNLQLIRFNNPYTILSTFLLGEKQLAELTRSTVGNTDIHPVVEFSRVTAPEMSPEIYADILRRKESVLPYCTNFNKEEEKAQREAIFLHEKAMFDMLKGLFQYRIAAGGSIADTTATKKAFQLMRKALDMTPDNKFNLLFFVDWVHQYDLTASLKYIRQAVAEEPKFAKASVLLGMECTQRAEWDSALTYYDAALAVNDRFISAWYNRGFALGQKQNWAESAASFEKVTELQPDNVFAHSSLSQVYYMLNNFPKALQHVQKSIELAPDEANSYFNMGMMYEKNGRIKEAIRAFEEGLKRAPQDKKAQEKLRRLKQR